MKTINIKTAEKNYPMLRDIELGEIFTLEGCVTPFMKSCMRENYKTKVVNLKSGEIINMSTDTRVVPYEAEINLTLKK